MTPLYSQIYQTYRQSNFNKPEEEGSKRKSCSNRNKMRERLATKKRFRYLGRSNSETLFLHIQQFLSSVCLEVIRLSILEKDSIVM